MSRRPLRELVEAERRLCLGWLVGFFAEREAELRFEQFLSRLAAYEARRAEQEVARLQAENAALRRAAALHEAVQAGRVVLLRRPAA